MKLIRVVELMNKYAICPQCGNDKVGGGAGTIEATGDTFRRTCKCGWGITVKDPVVDESTVYGNDCRTGRCEM